MKRIFQFSFFILHFSLLTNAQQMLGMHSSNHSSIYRATFNPSAVAGTKYKFHINAAAFNASLNNKYFAYFRTDALFVPIKAPYTTNDLYGKSKLIGTTTEGENVNIAADLRLPAVFFDVTKFLTLGFSTRLRGFLQGSGLPTVVNEVYTKRLDFGNLSEQSGSFKNFTMSQQSFFETGITVAAVPLDIPKLVKIRVGATFKKISGARNVFLKVNSTNYQVKTIDKDNASFELSNLNYEYGYTNPVQDFSLGSIYTSDYGSGWATDFGATVEFGRIRSHADYRANYWFRLGIALTDVGSISYPTAGKIYSGTLSKITIDQTKMVGIGDNSVKTLESILPKTNIKNYNIATQLPATLNLDVDLHLAKSFFLNATLIKPTKSGSLPTAIYQPQILTLTPRFEDADAEFTLPISWIEGNTSPTVGISARFGPIFIGFSNFTGVTKMYGPKGSFAYFGVQFWKMRKDE